MPARQVCSCWAPHMLGSSSGNKRSCSGIIIKQVQTIGRFHSNASSLRVFSSSSSSPRQFRLFSTLPIPRAPLASLNCPAIQDCSFDLTCPNRPTRHTHPAHLPLQLKIVRSDLPHPISKFPTHLPPPIEIQDCHIWHNGTAHMSGHAPRCNRGPQESPRKCGIR